MTSEADGRILLRTSSQDKNVLLISRDLIFLNGDSWPSGKMISNDENRFPLSATLLVICRDEGMTCYHLPYPQYSKIRQSRANMCYTLKVLKQIPRKIQLLNLYSQLSEILDLPYI